MTCHKLMITFRLHFENNLDKAVRQVADDRGKAFKNISNGFKLITTCSCNESPEIG
jgi:hypothetical protein